MLQHIRIENFKSLLQVEVDLGAFNVLVGGNDCGKTSFLQAVQWLGKKTFPTEYDSYIWQKQKNRSIVLQARGKATKSFEYRLEVRPRQQPPVERLKIADLPVFETTPEQLAVNLAGASASAEPGRPVLQQLAELERKSERRTATSIGEVVDVLTSFTNYQFDPSEMRRPAVGPSTPEEAAALILEPSGRNLAAVLATILASGDRQGALDLEAELRRELPTFRGISTPPGGTPGTFQIHFTLNMDVRPPVSIPSEHASNGAMLLLGYLAVVYRHSPGILLVEEPENGLHPSRIKMVVDLLRKISSGAIGNQRRQVILTTHSPLILNFVKPEEVRIFHKDSRGAVQVTRMDTVPNLEQMQKGFSPGELWYLLGEEELLKGQAA
jgi:predicted ATPase